MLTHLKQWWLTHSVWVFAVVQFLVPSINNYIHNHPGTFLGTVAVMAIARLAQGQGGSNVTKT